MQQEGGRRSDQEELRQNKQPQQQPQPQKCPRCDSLDTKFCYYNNYSLSQPRYLCKNCRRYWTHGGTLRNVPVGGGCRKGKRAKTSSFATTSSGTTASTTNSTSNIAPIAGGGALRTNKETVENSVGPTPHPPTGFSPMGFGSFSYPAIGGGGFLSSLAAIQSFTHPGVGGINIGGDLGGRSTGGSSSDLGLLMHGFNSNVPPLLAPPQFRSQLQCQQPITRQFYHLGGDGNANSKSTSSITTTSLVGQGPPAFSYPQEDSLIQSRRAPVAVSTAEASSSSHQQLLNWPHHQGFTYPNISDIYLWSTSTTTNTTTGTTTTTTSSPVGSSSMNPNQWHDLPGHGPPR